MRLSQLTMRIINFSDNTTYVSDGESYRLDGRNHNIQRIDKKWMVDGRATTFSEMIKMGVAVKKTPEETQKDLEEALLEVRDSNPVVVKATGIIPFLKSVFRMLFHH